MFFFGRIIRCLGILKDFINISWIIYDDEGYLLGRRFWGNSVGGFCQLLNIKFQISTIFAFSDNDIIYKAKHRFWQSPWVTFWLPMKSTCKMWFLEKQFSFYSCNLQRKTWNFKWYFCVLLWKHPTRIERTSPSPLISSSKSLPSIVSFYCYLKKSKKRQFFY